MNYTIMLSNSSFEKFDKKKWPHEFLYWLGFLILFLFINDELIAGGIFFSSQIRACYDVVVHGLACVLVIYPIYKKEIYWNIPRLFLLGTLLDIDHFISAQSFSIMDAMQLPLRPDTHSITFAILVALVGFFLIRSKIVGWTLFAAITSHVIRDTVGGNTPIFWPLKIFQISPWIYYGTEVVLLYFSFQISHYQRTQ